MMDLDGRKRLSCPECGWINYENPVPVVSCAAINRTGEILITKRNIEPGKNKWALPGGFVERNESPEKSCLRELKEETGIDGKITKLIGVYLQKTKMYGDLLVIGYAAKVLNDDIAVNNELKEARFANRKNMPYIPFLSHRRIIKEYMYEKP